MRADCDAAQGSERLMFWRESSSGSSTTAYFLAKSTVFMLDTLLVPLIFLCTLRYVVRPWPAVGRHCFYCRAVLAGISFCSTFVTVHVQFSEHVFIACLVSWICTGTCAASRSGTRGDATRKVTRGAATDSVTRGAATDSVPRGDATDSVPRVMQRSR